jgi:hypothetical protein
MYLINIAARKDPLCCRGRGVLHDSGSGFHGLYGLLRRDGEHVCAPPGVALRRDLLH